MTDLDKFFNDIENGTVETPEGWVGARTYELAWERENGDTITQTMTSGFGEQGAIESMRELLPSDARAETLRVVREIIESHMEGEQ
ncbi:MAG TPA: hypothetical protein VGC91_08060 [Pyrinomonadaceae bacterium]|jgi:hypothetical protein